MTDMPASSRHVARRRMQMVFQDPQASLNPRLPVLELIGEAPRVHGLLNGASQVDFVAGWLERVGLSPDMMRRYAHQFSGGQRARIGIARALAMQPELLICDEAVASLDVSVQAQVLDLLMDLRQELGLTCLFISHDLSVVNHVSDRVAVMWRGRLVELGPVQAVMDAPLHGYTRRLLTAVPRLDRPAFSFEQAAAASALPVVSGAERWTEAQAGHYVLMTERP